MVAQLSRPPRVVDPSGREARANMMLASWCRTRASGLGNAGVIADGSRTRYRAT